MKLWLDDIRPMPSRYDVHVLTAPEAIRLLAIGNVTDISLDHDLGPPEAGTGYDVATYIEACAHAGIIPKLDWMLHTDNPVGRERMRAALHNADRFWAQQVHLE
jgi:hypothetical protein